MHIDARPELKTCCTRKSIALIFLVLYPVLSFDPSLQAIDSANSDGHCLIPYDTAPVRFLFEACYVEQCVLRSNISLCTPSVLLLLLEKTIVHVFHCIYVQITCSTNTSMTYIPVILHKANKLRHKRKRTTRPSSDIRNVPITNEKKKELCLSICPS